MSLGDDPKYAIGASEMRLVRYIRRQARGATHDDHLCQAVSRIPIESLIADAMGHPTSSRCAGDAPYTLA